MFKKTRLIALKICINRLFDKFDFKMWEHKQLDYTCRNWTDKNSNRILWKALWKAFWKTKNTQKSLTQEEPRK